MNEKKQRIIKLLEERGELLFPREIANILKLNPSTVKNYLRDLTKDGDIFRDEAHRYCSKTTYGVVKPLLIHNLRFKCEAPWLRDMPKIEDDDERTGGIHFWVQYGKRNGLITGGIAYDKGLDQAHVLLLITRFYGLVESKTNHKVDSFLVTTLEWNRDYKGKRIDNRDGLRCFTYDEFENYLTRVYQKDEMTVRVETKTSKPMTLNELLETQNAGSLGGSMNIELANRIIEKMESLIDVNKYFNARVNGIENLTNSLLKNESEIVTNQVNLSREFIELKSLLTDTLKAVAKLSESNEKLVDPLSRIADVSEEQREEFKKRKSPPWSV